MTATAEKLEPSSGAIIDFALEYARRGWHVFPCWPGDKSPCVGNDKDAAGQPIPKTGGLYKATTDENQIKVWWQRWPKAMIGVRMGATSGVWAIDPDAPKRETDADGRATWARLTAQHGAVHTHAHQTPGGGQHLLFKWDANRPITNKEGQLKRSGINVRGEGGYIIAPPSINADGRSYEIVEPLDHFNFADAPDWLYDLVLTPSISEQAQAKAERPRSDKGSFSGATPHNRRPYAEAALRAEVQAVASCINGNRNNQLNTSAFSLGTLVGAGELTEGEVIGALYDAAVACGLVADDGQHAVMATINSGLSEGIKHPRNIPPWEEDVFSSFGKNYQTASKNGEQQYQEDKEQPRAESASTNGGSVIEIFWHGKNYSRPPRSWLAKDLIPETGNGLLAGQWGTAKTFTALDLSACTMTGTPFAGREIVRKGGVLFIAAEGASEIPIRLQGVVDHKLAPLKLSKGAAGDPFDADLERLPFAWIEECPNLKEGFDRIVAASQSAAGHIKEQFNLPLALIIVDTLNAAANFKDGNDAAEGQFIMNRLNELSRKTGAFVIAVDHFGKAVETGTRGTSAKEGAADMVLALLAERDTAGNISNTRMAVRKLRGGATGAETPFDLQVVDIGDGETTCIIDWKQGAQEGRRATDQRERWPRSTKILKAALVEALNNEGVERDPFGDGKMKVKTVATASVRAEFMKRYPADGDEPNKQAEAKRKAFRRSMETALDRDLIGSREIAGIDHLWLALVADHAAHP
ncbi:bifunctional DNA primase/polymerase [Nitrobacter sp.]|uniref:bifunctional DNA primase/polymerase n=1 Tax=Nitrobacter sp. TaxID=29420 RepID=UPI0032202AA9